MKWLKQNKHDLYLRVRDYFGEEYFAAYGPDEINICDLEHTDDANVEFFQESPIDDVLQSRLDDNDGDLYFF
jgi:hypothetical protein